MSLGERRLLDSLRRYLAKIDGKDQDMMGFHSNKI